MAAPAAPVSLTREIQPLTPFQPRVASSFPKSTIAPSAQKAVAPPMVKPTLLPPSKMRLALFVKELEMTQAKIVDTFCDRLKTMTSESNQEASEYQKQLKENSDRADTHLFWSFLKKIWSAVFSAVTALFGVFNLTGGNVVVGTALIASGTLSLANLICSEMGVWEEVAKELAENDKERQKQIAFFLPLAVTVLSAGLALFGGVYNFAQTQTFFSQQLGFALIASLSILNSIVEIGQGITQARLLYSQADLLKIQTALESTHIQTKMCTEALGSFFAATQGIFERLGRVMQIAAQTNLSLLQG